MPTDEQIAALPFDLYRQYIEHYGKTHTPPNGNGRYTTSRLLAFMRFNLTDHIDLIDQPLLMMAESKADSLHMSDEAFPTATGCCAIWRQDGQPPAGYAWGNQGPPKGMGEIRETHDAGQSGNAH
jgi:hypothetical protein